MSFVDDDKEYYYRRAESELEMAQRTENPEAVKAHYTLAGYYLDKVYNDDAPPSWLPERPPSTPPRRPLR